MRTFKCMLVGPACGKTTWLNGFLEEEEEVTPTLGVKVIPLRGQAPNVVFNVWEVGHRHPGLGITGYGVGAHCAIVYLPPLANAGPYLAGLPPNLPHVVVYQGTTTNPFPILANMLS